MEKAPTSQQPETNEAAVPRSSRSADARARRSALALRDALLTLLETTPFDRITIRDICREAGIHYATFFRHHQSRESLLDEIARKEIEHLNALTLAIRDAENYQSGFRALCAYVDDHRALWSVLLNGGAAGTMREEWLRQIRQVAAREVPVNLWLPTGLATVCTATLITETLAWWLGQPEGAYSVEQISGIMYRLITSSVMAPD